MSSWYYPPTVRGPLSQDDYDEAEARAGRLQECPECGAYYPTGRYCPCADIERTQNIPGNTARDNR